MKANLNDLWKKLGIKKAWKLNFRYRLKCHVTFIKKLNILKVTTINLIHSLGLNDIYSLDRSKIINDCHISSWVRDENDDPIHKKMVDKLKKKKKLLI